MDTIDFDGVFRFTNVTDEDFVTLWNNKEYLFPAGKTVPLVIPDETLENIQEIRKRFAHNLATREFYSGKVYKTMSKQGGGLPPLFDEKLLEPMIEACLTPLPSAKISVKQLPEDNEKKYKGSKAMSEKENPNYLFREEADNAKALGKQPDILIN